MRIRRQLVSTALFVSAAFGLAFGLTPAINAQPNSQNSTASAKLSAEELVSLGLKYEHAEGVNRDFLIAQQAYCAAAAKNSADAYLRLGWMYANGRGVARSDVIASTLFKKAASLGDEMGQRLSEMIRGEGTELPPCLQATNSQALTRQLDASLSSGKGLLKSEDLPALPTIKTTPFVPFSQQTAAEKSKTVNLVASLAKEFRLDPRLVLAVIRAESNFDPLARSPKGAQGLMQLIPETAERFAVKDITDPADNMRGGMAYLKWLLSFFQGDVVLTLAAYNSGEKTVERFGGVPPYPETMAYVQRIRSLYPSDFHAFDNRAASFRKTTKPSAKQ